MATLTGLVFAAAGIAVNLHVLAERLLPRILTRSPGIEFQEIIAGRPVPSLLDWSYAQIALLSEVRDISPWAIAVCALIFGTLWMTIVRILNPTFRPLSRRIFWESEPILSQNESVGAATVESVCGSEGVIVHTDSADETLRTDSPAVSAIKSGIEPAHITLDRIHLEQALRLLLAVGLPILAVWYTTGSFGNEPLIGRGHQTGAMLNGIQLIRYLVLGIGIFVAYSQSGLAGRFGILHQAYQSDEAVAQTRPTVNLSSGVSLTLKGCVFGAALWCLTKCALGPPDSELLDRFQSLGTFNLAYYSLIAGSFIVSAAIVWFLAGTMIYLLGKPGLRLTTRVTLACFALVGVMALVGIKRPFTTNAIGKRYDTTKALLASVHKFDQKHPTASVPSGLAAATELARLVPVQVIDDKPMPCEDMVAFDPRGTFEIEIDKITDDGLITDHSKCADVQAFLDKRRFRSALSWAAVKYLFNDANIRFDQAAEIRTGLDDLENSPHMLNTGETMRAIFFLCAASAKNLALLDEYADEARFVHRTRESQRLMGDLYTRFGEVTKALYWYHKADMPHSFIHQITIEKPLFHTGTVTGKFTWNGAPMAGVQVGAAPQRLNGLPIDLRPSRSPLRRRVSRLRSQSKPTLLPISSGSVSFSLDLWRNNHQRRRFLHTRLFDRG